jgi:glucose-6-phosphate isomerase
VVAIGIGGSYLGPEFVYEALRGSSEVLQAECGMQLRFLANVDPIDFSRAVDGIDPETTLFIIVSKTFTTAETMLNAKLARKFIETYYAGTGVKELQPTIEAHMCAVSTNLTATKEFGIKDENVFGFWDWVGGRFSVSSAVGLLPLSLRFGYPVVENFLKGMYEMDSNFKTASFPDNLPVMLGLIGFYNTFICGLNARALLPYCQALLRFPAHVQQLDMESNGKSVTLDGQRFASNVHAGPIIFGEPGTNGQHSFYQLMH